MKKIVAKLDGFVSPEMITGFIFSNYDQYFKQSIFTDGRTLVSDLIKENPACIRYNNSPYVETVSGSIDFIYHHSSFSLHYFYSNVNLMYDFNSSLSGTAKKIAKSNTTSLYLPYSREAVDILHDICNFFGGWFNADSSRDDNYMYISRKSSADLPQIRTVSLSDVYRKFGYAVKIEQ